MNPSFNPKDAQAKQVLGEAAALQKIIYLKTGPEYVRWLRETELPGMGMGPDLVNEYVGSLEMLDIKGFRQFFQVFTLPPEFEDAAKPWIPTLTRYIFYFHRHLYNVLAHDTSGF
ncbi:KapM [Coccidioides immitis RMSCC 3703]|uniref:Exportin-T n=1 Tax=Coccidioides immitis RMSCC 3703 TaxID=454286 RepID=A0A0J8QPQ8_COCIT|nr:KapM [Coccidioides immitis RMSCC 3703]